jgi:superfamily II DNA or RNA helicase
VPKAILSNYLWIKKADVKGTPAQFAPEWEYRIDLLKTAEGKIAQQQIAFLREQATASGDDPNDVAKELTDSDKLVVKNWSEAGDWWALCLGDQTKVRQLASDLGLTLDDRRVEVPWPDELLGKLKTCMTPRDNQVSVMKTWAEANHGLLQAAPAFGKTFVFIDSIITRQQSTIVLVHTDALADQFLTRFRHGSPNDDGGYTPITNCLAVEKELGYEVVGRYSGPDNLYPITVATWQSFISPSGKKALKSISKSFGYLIADEAHVFAAPAPASTVNGFHARVRQGCSATPKRKDQLDIALYDIIGPVTAHGKAAQLPITSYLISTGCKYPPRRYPSRAEWAKIINWLMKQEDRNQLIFDWVKHDVLVEDRSVLILGDRVQWALEAAETLTKEFRIPAKAVIGGMNTKRGIEERSRTIQDMMDRKIRVITATSVFKAGIDIPNLDTLYYIVPQNNVSQLQQALGRVRRKYDDKKSPVFRYFIDEGHGLLFGCARGTHRALVEEDSEIVMVSEGRKPGQVHANRVFDGDKMSEAKGFRAVASKQKEAMSALFTDLRQEEKLKEEYNRRLGRKKT